MHKLGWRSGGRRHPPATTGTATPFTEREIHQLAFGLPEQWVGIINRERWRAHGAVVMEAWRARVEEEQIVHERIEHEVHELVGEQRARPAPWPVTFYGRPDSTAGARP